MHPAVVNDNIPAEAEIELAVWGLKFGESGRPVRYESGGPEGVTQGGQAGEGDRG